MMVRHKLLRTKFALSALFAFQANVELDRISVVKVDRSRVCLRAHCSLGRARAKVVKTGAPPTQALEL